MPGGSSSPPKLSQAWLLAGFCCFHFGGGPIGCCGPSLAFAEISFERGERPGGSSRGGGSGAGGGPGEPSQIL